MVRWLPRSSTDFVAASLTNKKEQLNNKFVKPKVFTHQTGWPLFMWASLVKDIELPAAWPAAVDVSLALTEGASVLGWVYYTPFRACLVGWRRTYPHRYGGKRRKTWKALRHS